MLQVFRYVARRAEDHVLPQTISTHVSFSTGAADGNWPRMSDEGNARKRAGRFIAQLLVATNRYWLMPAAVVARRGKPYRP